MMQIMMPRGDMVSKSFVIWDPDKALFTNQFDEIYFTVKKTYRDRNYLFQKRLSNGGIVNVGEGKYQFTIMPEDTNNLDFGEYMFDIELVIEGQMKKTFTGRLRLTEESTHATNEVIS